ncbi:MAG: histidinol dehydrogenase [Candidatus Eremiobacteraeota bacterium]|nr:histidinol dehydrogenase [Candidatus Eremiobacteraeota bacterium]
MRVISAADRMELADAFGDGWNVPDRVRAEVASIIGAVRVKGDAALLECARRFDDEAFDLSQLRVELPSAEKARSLLSPEIASAFELAKERIVRFHERQRQADLAYGEEDGSRYAMYRRPLESIAAYVPGSAEALPMTLLMCVLPAKLAGVERVAVLTPPRRGGPHPAILFACNLCGVDELYSIGGAHAVAAAAYGTESVARVEKIVGPGSIWVTEAKRQVFGRCGIDGLNGPKEVLVVADEGANSEYVAGELLAQAEHAGVARLAVVSESRSLLEAVAQLLDTLEIKTLDRGEEISEAIESNCKLVHAPTRDAVFDVIERFAPAYLCLQVRDASMYVPRIRAAGAIFVGDLTPLACGDYVLGTNSVVPTAGTARFTSGLSLSDFTRTITVVENSMERMMSDALTVAALAELEGFPQHAQTARMRFGG